MYAIVNIHGNQTRVAPDETVDVPRLTGEPGALITFDQVLMVADGDRITVGQPYVKGANLTVEVVKHFRGPKIHVFKFKRRKDYKRRHGHRDERTRLRIKAIQA